MPWLQKNSWIQPRTSRRHIAVVPLTLIPHYEFVFFMYSQVCTWFKLELVKLRAECCLSLKCTSGGLTIWKMQRIKRSPASSTDRWVMSWFTVCQLQAAKSLDISCWLRDRSNSEDLLWLHQTNRGELYKLTGLTQPTKRRRQRAEE